MRWTIALAGILCLFAAPLCAQSGKAPDKKKILAEPIPGYKHEQIEGFDLLVHEDVYKHNDDPEYKRRPLEVLEGELETVVSVLPPRALAVLRKLVIWVEWYDADDPDIGRAVAKYYGVYGSAALWALGRGKHPLKANNVEIIDMKSLTEEHQPGVGLERCVILHELAHAVHIHLFGADNPHVEAAYDQAMQRKLYDESKDAEGRPVRPYAAASEREYFAELSCAYLNRLHYFPHNRDDLKKHDPAGYQLMERCWGTAAQLDRALAKAAEVYANKKMNTVYKLLRFNQPGYRERAVALLEEIIEKYPKAKITPRAKQYLARIKQK